MAKIKTKEPISPISMSPADRDAEIKRLERERVSVNEEIEILLREYAKLTGERGVKPRKHRPASQPNDYDFKRKKRG